jgi:hypothetical protein
MCLQVSYNKKKYEENIFLCIFQVTEERSQIRIRIPVFVRGADPDPHQNARIPNTVFSLRPSLQHFKAIGGASWLASNKNVHAVTQMDPAPIRILIRKTLKESLSPPSAPHPLY